MAAIHARFPNSGIIKRLQVVRHLDAQQFFSQWPDVVRAADDMCDADIQLSTKFREDETQNAFLAFSARLKNMEAVTRANQEHLLVISRRTEHFSPSKPQATVRHLPATASVPRPPTRFIPHGSFPVPTSSEHPIQFPLPPQFLVPKASSVPTSQMPVVGGCAATVTPLQHSVSTAPLVSLPKTPSPPPLRTSAQSSLVTACPTTCVPISVSSADSSLLITVSGDLAQTTTPSSSTTFMPTAGVVSPSTPSRSRPLHHVERPTSIRGPQFMSSQVPEPLIPYVVARTEGQISCVLPLIPQVPGQDQARTSRDLILPPPEAFFALNTPLPPVYPLFHTHNCTWGSVLSLVQQPSLLWPSYAPKNLGEYADITTLWQTWEEGMSIEGVGCMPPLRLIDERWGSCLGQRARWRPQGDPLVSVLPML